jgi:DNA-binding Xre family transcriptional regulator
MARLRVREVAQAKGFSMGLLSRKANLTIGVIRQLWRNDQYDVSFSTLQRLAAALDCKVSELIEDDESTAGGSKSESEDSL